MFRQMSDVVAGWGGGAAGVSTERLNQQTTTKAAKAATAAAGAAAIRMMTRTPGHGEINVCDLPIMWVILPAFWVCVSPVRFYCVYHRGCVRVCASSLPLFPFPADRRGFDVNFISNLRRQEPGSGAFGEGGFSPESHSICQLLRPNGKIYSVFWGGGGGSGKLSRPLINQFSNRHRGRVRQKIHTSHEGTLS